MKNKNMISIFVCMLLIAVSFSSVTALIDNNEYCLIQNDEYYTNIQQILKTCRISDNNWSQQAKLIASDGVDGDFFGQSVSIYEDVALVGSPNNDENGEMAGAAYIFTRSGDNWVEQEKLLASDGTEGDLFGWSVSIDGDYALIGSPFNEENGRLAGSAYIFTRSSDIWTEQAKLLPADAEEYDEFGQSVSINKDNALVGVYLDDDLGFASGSVYLFTRSGTNWIENTKFLPSDGMDGDWFGLSVSIDSNSILIGTPSSDDSGVDSGSAYVFKREGNQPPTAPEIDGPTNGKAGTSYDYNFTATDTDGDDVKYYIDWGDGDTEWTGFSASGTPVIVSHTWAEKDTYTIAAKAQDEYGLESDLATLEVEMPVNQQVINPLLQMILERFPNAFPILRHMLGL